MRAALRRAMTNATGGGTEAPAAVTPAAATAPALPAPAGVDPNGAPVPPSVTPAAAPQTTPVPRRLPGRATPVNPAGAVPGVPPPAFPVPGSVPPPVVVAPDAAGQPNLPGGANVAGQINPNALADATSNLAAGVDPNEILSGDLLQVYNMPLDQFLYDVYQKFSGRTVIRGSTVAQGSITLRAETELTRSQAIYAMNEVLAQNGIAMINVGEVFAKAVPAQNAPPESTDLNIGKKAAEYSESGEFVNHLVELKAIKPSEIIPMIQGLSKIPNGLVPFDNNNQLLIRDYALNVKRMLEIIEKTDVIQQPEYILEVVPIKYGRVEEFYDTMNSLVGGSGGGTTGGGAGLGGGGVGGLGQAGIGGTRSTARRSTTGVGSRFGGQSYGGAGGYGGYGGYGGAGGGYGGYGNYGGIRPQQATPPTSVGGAQTTFNSNLQRALSTLRGTNPQDQEVKILENARIVPDPRSNQLFIYAHRRDISMITNIVAKMDVLLAQVLIEAVIFEVSLGDSMNLGVSIAQNPRRFGSDFSGAGASLNGASFLNAITNFPAGAPSGFSYYGMLGNDFDVALQAIAENSNINVVSRPRIQTSHAIPGEFFLGQTVPYVTGAIDYGFVSSGVSSRSQIQQVRVGFGLNVTPYITPEGYVVMDIQQEFNSLGRDVIIDGNPIPVVNDRNASAVLTVKDGQTIMMGGFITESKSKSKSGVPFLKDIPILGFPFRSKNDRSDRTELVVLMRARVINTPEEAALIAEEEKGKLYGVTQAENQFIKEDGKRRKQSQRKSR